jgi:serine/threonine-protein kinase
MPQPFPSPADVAPTPTGQSRFVPAPGPAQPAGRDFGTSRTMTPAGDITAVETGAPGVNTTNGGTTDGWSRPSETPTQIGGEPSGVRSLSGDTGTGVISGQTLGERYRIVRKIGAGGMGEVWEAQHIVIKKSVAIKVLTLDPTLTNGAEQAERLMREARLVAAIQHDNVVDITDFGHTPMGAPYFVMELLTGSTLKSVIEQQGPVPWQRARDVLEQITDALAAAHAAGIIHRDIKPENVFLQQRGGKEVVKLIDFGIAKTTVLGDDGASLTQTGMVCGTPAFMSPEQARGEKIDERTDIYSLGCLAYQMLAGRQPFVANTPAEALYQQLFVEPTPLREVAPQQNIPANLDAIVLTCMRKNRNLRFQSMDDINRALENLERASAALSVPREDIPAPPTEVQNRFASVAPVSGHAPGQGLEFTDDRYDTGAMPVQGKGSGGLVAGILGGALVLGAGGGAAYYFLVLQGGQAASVEEVPAAIDAPSEDDAAAVAGETGAAGEQALGAETGAEEPEAAETGEAVGEDGAAGEPEPVVAGSGGRSAKSGSGSGSGGRGPAPVQIEPNPVYHDEDHVADSQGPEDLPPPPPLPDAEPDAEPEPEPEPEPPKPPPEPDPEPVQKPKPPKDKDGKKVDDLRDPWDRG